MLIFGMLGIEILLFFASYRLTGRDIFRPSTLMLGVFLISTTVAAINFDNWNINYSIVTLIVMTIGLSCAVFTDAAIYKIEERKDGKSGQQSVYTIIKVNNISVLIVCVFEVLVLIVYLHEIIRLAYADGYQEGGNLLWHFRNITSYQATESINGIISLLIRTIDAIAYVFTFIVIWNCLAHEKASKIIIKTFPIILFAVKVIMGSGRQDLLRLIAFAIVCSVLLIRDRDGWKDNALLTKKIIATLIVAIALVLILFYLATDLIGRSTTRSFYDYITTYVGGSIQQFNQYITDPVSKDQTSLFGEETFPGIYFLLKRLGLLDYSGTVHLELRQLGITQGNVYTFFRRPLHDFGLIGMCVMTICVIGMFSLWYSKRKNKTSNTGKISTILFCYLYYWIVISSIDNYSIGIVSIGTLYTMIMICVLFWIITRSGPFILIKGINGRCIKEMKEDREVIIDKNSACNIYKLMPYKYEVVEFDLKDVVRDYEGKIAPLDKTLIFEVMEDSDNVSLREKYEHYAGEQRNRIDNPDRGIDQLLKILESIKTEGYQPQLAMIIIDQFNIILDGYHKSCAILATHKECEQVIVKGLRVSRIRISPRTLISAITKYRNA